MHSHASKAAMAASVLLCTVLLAAGHLLAQPDPFTLTFQASAGAGQTNISVTITPSAGFAAPTQADKILVKSLDPNTGAVTLTAHYSDVPLAAGNVVLSFPEVAADTPLSVQVTFKTVDDSRTRVLRAGTAVLSDVDLSIDGVAAPSQVMERVSFNVTVTVRELTGTAPATCDVQIFILNTSPAENPSPVATVTGVGVAAGGTVNVVVPVTVNQSGSSSVRTFTASLANISPNDSVAPNNSLSFPIEVLCSGLDNDCGD